MNRSSLVNFILIIAFYTKLVVNFIILSRITYRFNFIEITEQFGTSRRSNELTSSFRVTILSKVFFSRKDKKNGEHHL